MTEIVPFPGLTLPLLQPVTWEAPFGLGPTTAVSRLFEPSSVLSSDSINFSCSLPSPYRPLPPEMAGRLLPAGLEEELRKIEYFYRRDPSETQVLAFLSTLQRHDLDLRALRDRLAYDCSTIVTRGAAFVSHSARDDFEVFLNRSFVQGRVDDAAFDASLYQPVERLLSDRLFRLIRDTPTEPVQQLMNEAFARHVLDENEESVVPLYRALDMLDARQGPPSRETLLQRIAILHQLTTATNHYFSEKSLWLRRASEDVEALSALSGNDAAVLRVENLRLRLEVEPLIIDREARSGLIDKDDATDIYAARVGSLYRELIRADRAALDLVTDPVGRNLLERDLAAAMAGMVEHDYGVALNFHVQDEDDRVHSFAEVGDEDLRALDSLENVVSPETFSEMRARGLLARSYYHFRTGRIEDGAGETGCLTDVETILRDYPDTFAARSIRAPGNWPERHGIVDPEGRLSPELHSADLGAALLTAASLLTENESRALVGCGIGAVIGAGADLIFGEKVTGAAIVSACVTGIVVERAVYVLANVDRIGQSYREGVSNTTAGDAFKSLGEFALTVLSFYGGAGLGAVFQRATISGGVGLGRAAGALLTRIGFTPGPWTRGIASFLLREAGFASNAAGFQGTVTAAQAILHPNARVEMDAENFLGGWAFVRFLPVFLKLNPAGFALPGLRLDPAALRVLNGALGVAGIEGTRELILGEDLSHYGDRVASGLFYMGLFHATSPHPATPSGGPTGPGPLNYADLRPGEVARIPLADIVPTQGKVFSAQVEAYRSGRLPADPPEIRVIDGVPYVVDGHNRLYAAYSSGAREVEVRNYDPATDDFAHLKPTLVERATRWNDVVVEKSQRVYGRASTDPRLN